MEEEEHTWRRFQGEQWRGNTDVKWKDGDPNEQKETYLKGKLLGFQESMNEGRISTPWKGWDEEKFSNSEIKSNLNLLMSNMSRSR